MYKKINFFIFSLQRWPLKECENENEKFRPLCFPSGDTEGGGRRGGMGVMMLGWRALGRPFDSFYKAILYSPGLFHLCVCVCVCVFVHVIAEQEPDSKSAMLRLCQWLHLLFEMTFPSMHCLSIRVFTSCNIYHNLRTSIIIHYSSVDRYVILIQAIMHTVLIMHTNFYWVTVVLILWMFIDLIPLWFCMIFLSFFMIYKNIFVSLLLLAC